MEREEDYHSMVQLLKRQHHITTTTSNKVGHFNFNERRTYIHFNAVVVVASGHLFKEQDEVF